MASSREIKMLTELLELEGVKVVSRHQHKGIGIILEIEPIHQELDKQRKQERLKNQFSLLP
uniref:Transposase n=2 Tax=Microcoleaceae TaxID=1892252 RepID=A0A9W4CTA4_9CYAN|nr:Transposase [Planktothrix pseudagardhii]